jgi:hypothetical protein
MVPLRARVHDDAVPRVLVLWTRPHHLTCEEAERWMWRELRAVAAADAVRSARLSRLEQASLRHGGDWRWLLELQIVGSVHDWIESEPCAEWLGDLRLLGMKVELVVAADPIELEAN